MAATGPLCAGHRPVADLLGRLGADRRRRRPARLRLRCVEAFAGVVPVVKPQVAFFERHGVGRAGRPRGGAGRRPPDAGLLVIADAKRGDIGSTMDAYASAWLDPASPLAADAVTVVRLPGPRAPCSRPSTWPRAGGRGVIVVVRSSNPEGRALQKAHHGGAAPSVEDMLLAEIAALNHGGLPGAGHGRGGIGATLDAVGLRPGRSRRGGPGARDSASRAGRPRAAGAVRRVPARHGAAQRVALAAGRRAGRRRPAGGGRAGSAPPCGRALD